MPKTNSDELGSMLRCRVRDASREAYREAAGAARMSESEWVRTVLDAAAGVSALPRQLMRVVDVSQAVKDGDW